MMQLSYADRSGGVGKDRAVDSNYATNRAIEPVSIHHSMRLHQPKHHRDRFTLETRHPTRLTNTL